MAWRRVTQLVGAVVAKPWAWVSARLPPRVDAALDFAALLACMQEHNADPEVQAQCCLSLWRSDDRPSEESALAFLPVILAALRAHPGHTDLQTIGCTALGRICLGISEAALSCSGVVDCLRPVLDAMQAHPTDTQLQSACCGALDDMTRSAQLRETAVAMGAVQVVVAALHASVLKDAAAGWLLNICISLNRLTSAHPLATTQAGAAGAVAAVVEFLRAPAASALLHATGCRALATLACDYNNKTKAVHAGAIEAILQAMRAHAADAEVQAYGCRALANISVYHTGAIWARSDRLSLDAITAAVATLHAHRGSTLAQQHGCVALSLLPANEELRVEAGKMGAVKAVLAALCAHPADAGVQDAGCGALGTLCTDNSANAVQACGAGALQAIVAALGAHPAEFQVQITGCHALLKLVDAHPRLQAAAGAAGAVEAIVHAMRVPAADATLLQFSHAALRAVVRAHRGNAERACAAGAMDALAAAMSSSDAHEDVSVGAVQMQHYSVYAAGLTALDALLQTDEDAARRAILAGLHTVVRDGAQLADPYVLPDHDRVLSLLQAAAQRHDAAACAHDGCRRCSAERDAGRMCALAGCAARKRADDSGKRLLRCGACRTAAYCGPAHQREHWERHKTECAALGAAHERGEEEEQ
jgi:hypothetical protein